MKELNEKKLRYYYVEKDFSQREIAEKFDLSQSSISKRMKKFGIESEYAGFWSDAEKQKLKENYREKSKEEIVSLLPDRTWEAIKLKAMELGLQILYRNIGIASKLRKCFVRMLGRACLR